MAHSNLSDSQPDRFDLQDCLLRQRKAFEADRNPDRNTRIHRLDRLHNAILDHQAALIETVSADFSNRASAETLLTEIYPVLETIAYYRKHLKKFMIPKRRRVPLTLQPARAWVQYQPLGVIGVVVPWNFPILLSLSPMIGALAAGNRVMIKLSEHTPVFSQAFRSMIDTVFSPDEVAVVTGGVDVARQFSSLPFDHLLFTGSSEVGKQVMAAAAANLTPVTLELGGKSPAIIHESYAMKEAATRLAFGKCINAGQTCVAPDFVLCPKDQVQSFSVEFQRAVARSYPKMQDNSDFTAIISDDQYTRLLAWLEDAQEKGARLIRINPAAEHFEQTRKLPVTLVLDATADMQVMREEIFGPILPVIGYSELKDALSFVNAMPKPLALYYFDNDPVRSKRVLAETQSGGVGLNDTLMHVAVDDLPFGGVGPSGMGQYHGEDGFRTFSKIKPVFRRGRFNPVDLIGPPWSNRLFRLFMKIQARRFSRRVLRPPK